MGHSWTIPDESQYVMRRSLPVIGVNDPDDKGEVRISFGAFLGAGSEELGNLNSEDPNRPRVRNGFMIIIIITLKMLLSQLG